MIDKVTHPDDIFGPKVYQRDGVIFKKDITPARAYDEFAVAMSIWFKYMDAQHERKALALVKSAMTLEAA